MKRWLSVFLLLATVSARADLDYNLGGASSVATDVVCSAGDCVDGVDLADTITQDADLVFDTDGNSFTVIDGSMTVSSHTLISGVLTVNGNISSTGTITTTGSGTNALTGPLTVDGNVTVGNASGDVMTVNADSVTFANDTWFNIQGGEKGLLFGNNGTDILSINASDFRIGIGTNAPASILSVFGTDQTMMLGDFDVVPLVYTAFSGQTNTHLDIGCNGCVQTILTLSNTTSAGDFLLGGVSGINRNLGTDQRNGLITFRTGTTSDDGNINFFTMLNNTVTQAARIDENGRLGIGTLVPDTKLHMSSGTFTIDGNVDPAITTGRTIILSSEPVVGATPTANSATWLNFAAVWGKINVSGGVPSIDDGLNISSVTDTAAGQVTISFATNFADTNYVCTGNATTDSANFVSFSNFAVESVLVNVRDSTVGSRTDNAPFSIICYGRQ